MSRDTSLLPIRSEEELLPKDRQVGLSSSNVRIDNKEVFTDPIHQLVIAILKSHIIYNSLILTATVPAIYIHQFWHIVSENEAKKKFFFQLDNQRFEVRVDLIRIVLQLTPTRLDQLYTTPTSKKSLLLFVKELGYEDHDNTLKTISQGLFHNHNLDYAELIWDEFKYLITSQMKSQNKAEKLLYPRFTKLIIAHLMSNNNAINQRSDATMYRSSMDERFKPAKVIKGGIIHYGFLILDTLLNDTIRKTRGKGPMIRGEGEVADPVESFKRGNQDCVKEETNI
ncbi:hypothetical protein Tco_0217023 [Tanacetum coccineum]